jgi:uncharacterized protein (UPF0332 family)
VATSRAPGPFLTRLKDKARANLKAARKLAGAKLLDPAMSRLYYALFQAGVHAMQRKGKKPEDFKVGAKGRWGHDVICGNANILRQGKDDRALFRDARSLREQADYDAAGITREHIDGVMDDIDTFVEEVCS